MTHYYSTVSTIRFEKQMVFVQISLTGDASRYFKALADIILKRDIQPCHWPVQGYVPLELVCSAAVYVILKERPIAGEYPCVIFAEQVELIANRTACAPGKIGTKGNATYISRQRQGPAPFFSARQISN